MSAPPPCQSVGPQCRSLEVTICVARLDPADPTSGDHEATWLFGHTERIQFGSPVVRQDALVAGARIDVPCRHAAISGSAVRCRAHGFDGLVAPPAPPRGGHWTAPDVAMLADHGRIQPVHVTAAPRPAQSLPVLENPCETARCRTADNRVGAACCRDLQLTVMCRTDEGWLESLIRNRKSPYVCKVEREGPDAMGFEAISACGFLNERRVCSLHGLERPDGRSAKPDLCFDWPERDDHYHPGCVFNPKNSP